MPQNKCEGRPVPFSRPLLPNSRLGTIDNTVCYSLVNFPREREGGKKYIINIYHCLKKQ